jgi:aerobic carbon-monoxide dehydrogenase medium subunit
MILRRFEYVEAKSVDDAIAALAAAGDDARVIAGGTALVPLMKHQLVRPALLVGVLRVSALADVLAGDDGSIHVGGAVTHWTVAHNALVATRSPLLASACGRVASPTIRSMGTLGGNLCYGESASDPSPALLALRARVHLCGPAGKRVLSLEEFFTGFYETALTPGEVLTTVEVPPMPAGARWMYLKWTPRAQEDKALVGLAAMLILDGRHCRLARLGLGGVSAFPVVLRNSERAIEGQELDSRTILHAADVAAEEVDPVDDLQGSADYRRDMLRVWVRRSLEQLSGMHR